MYFCTSKPSKLSSKLAVASEEDRKVREEKKVGLFLPAWHAAPQASVFVLCTSKITKLSGKLAGKRAPPTTRAARRDIARTLVDGGEREQGTKYSICSLHLYITSTKVQILTRKKAQFATSEELSMPAKDRQAYLQVLNVLALREQKYKY